MVDVNKAAHITVAGRINDVNFQKARIAAEVFVIIFPVDRFDCFKILPQKATRKFNSYHL